MPRRDHAGRLDLHTPRRDGAPWARRRSETLPVPSHAHRPRQACGQAGPRPGRRRVRARRAPRRVARRDRARRARQQRPRRSRGPSRRRASCSRARSSADAQVEVVVAGQGRVARVLATELGGRIEAGERVAGTPKLWPVRVWALGQLHDMPIVLMLPSLARDAIVRDRAIDFGAAPTLVPARPRTLRPEALDRVIDIADVARGLLDLLAQQRPQPILDHAVQREVRRGWPRASAPPGAEDRPRAAARVPR